MSNLIQSPWIHLFVVRHMTHNQSTSINAVSCLSLHCILKNYSAMVQSWVDRVVDFLKQLDDSAGAIRLSSYWQNRELKKETKLF